MSRLLVGDTSLTLQVCQKVVLFLAIDQLAGINSHDMIRRINNKIRMNGILTCLYINSLHMREHVVHIGFKGRESCDRAWWSVANKRVNDMRLQ